MDGLDIRTTPFSYYKDSTFLLGTKVGQQLIRTFLSMS